MKIVLCLLFFTNLLAGLEAPRNSLDVSLETPPSREVKNEDIPVSVFFEFPSPLPPFSLALA
jgi:hypothetical protein